MRGASIRFWLLAGLVALLAGCAHPISLSGDTAALVGSGPAAKVDKRVGLAISDEQRKREFTSAGGGGDKVSYSPYRDLETGLYLALAENFTSVSRVSGVADPKVPQERVALVVAPEISTSSYSPSVFTWPPTIFTITLECTVKDASDRVVTRIAVQGEGRAEYDEFKADFSLSAKRAAQDALKKLIKAFADAAPTLR